jgi:hypothetical protein
MYDCEWHLHAKIGEQTTNLCFPSWQVVIDRVVPLAVGHPLEKTIRHEVGQALPEKPWSLWGDDCVFKLRPIKRHEPMDLTPFIEVHETPGEHAELGASSSSQWMNCPGRNQLIRQTRETQPQALIEVGDDARIGTVAHSLIEMALRDGQDTITYIDRPIHIYDRETGEVHYTHHVDDMMATNTQVFVDEARKYEDADVCQVEAKLSLNKLDPPAPMFGTTDFYAIYFSRKLLVVQDYKNGRVPVDPKTSQLKFYAVQVLVNLPDTVPQPDRVLVKIVQPRGVGQVVKEHEYSTAELMNWAMDELLPAARRTLAPDAPLVAGDHCLFCPVRAVCPARTEYMLEKAGIEADVSQLPAELQQRVIPAIESIPLPELSKMYLAAQPLLAWARDAEKALKKAIGEGYEDSLYKVETGQGHRKWVDTDKLVTAMAKLNVDPEKLWIKRIVSPKQAEDVAISQLRTMKLPMEGIRPMVRSMIDDLTTRPESAPKLVLKGGNRQLSSGPTDISFEVDLEGVT